STARAVVDSAARRNAASRSSLTRTVSAGLSSRTVARPSASSNHAAFCSLTLSLPRPQASAVRPSRPPRHYVVAARSLDGRSTLLVLQEAGHPLVLVGALEQQRLCQVVGQRVWTVGVQDRLGHTQGQG